MYIFGRDWLSYVKSIDVCNFYTKKVLENLLQMSLYWRKIGKLAFKSFDLGFNLIRGCLVFFCFEAAEIFCSCVASPRMTRKGKSLKMTASAFTLALILTFGIISESQAEKICDCGKVNPTDCCWEVKGSTLYITGSGEMKDYSWRYDDEGRGVPTASWREYTYNSDVVTKIDIQGVSSIGNNAFRGFMANQLAIGDTVASIGVEAFGYSSISGELNLPPSLKNIGEKAFVWAGKITSVVIPDSVETIEQSAFYGTVLTSLVIPSTTKIKTDSLGGGNRNIICKGNEETCADLNEQLENYVAQRTYGDLGFYNLDLSTSWQAAKKEQCTDSYIWLDGACYKRNESQCNGTENYYWNGTSCIYRPSSGKIACSSSYKVNDGYCDRIRYTPAEAAAVVHKDDNTITLTFKK